MNLIEELQHTEKTIQQQLLFEAQQLIDSENRRFENLKKDHHDRLVSLRAIEKICLKYRLRFLDIRFFKSEVPAEAMEKLHALETDYKVELKKLHIIAPGELFKLENREKDPLLVAELYDQTFVIIHKWGKEFNRYRALQALPLRNIPNMALTLGLIALLVAVIMLPFTGGHETPLKTFVFGFVVMWGGMASYATFISLSQNIFPTTLIWNSKFLD